MTWRVLLDLTLVALGVFLVIRGHLIYRRMARTLFEAKGGDPKQFQLSSEGVDLGLTLFDDYFRLTGDRRSVTICLLLSYGGVLLFLSGGLMLIMMADAAGLLPVNHR